MTLLEMYSGDPGHQPVPCPCVEDPEESNALMKEHSINSPSQHSYSLHQLWGYDPKL